MASNVGAVYMAGIGATVDGLFRIICCVGFALIVVMLFHFVLARYRSRVARTEVSEILESSMNYYTHSQPYADLDPNGYSYERLPSKKNHW